MSLRSLLRAQSVPWASRPVAACRVGGYTAAFPAPLSSVGAHAGRRGTKNLDWYYNAIAESTAKAAAPPTPVFPCEPLTGKPRVRAFLDLAAGSAAASSDAGAGASAPTTRIVVELADDLTPLTVKNFLDLCARPVGKGYRGSEAFQVRKGTGITFGDWKSNSGRTGHSAFATRTFADENFIVRHATPGVLTMANSGVHSNNSVFMITLAPMPHLDGRNVAFGRVLSGMDALQKLGSTFTVNLKPATPIVIKDAGILPDAESAALDKQLAAATAAAASAAAKKAPATK